MAKPNNKKVKNPDPMSNARTMGREGMRIIKDIAFGKYNIYNEGHIFRNLEFVTATLAEVDKRVLEANIHVNAIQYAYSGTQDPNVLNVLMRDKKTPSNLFRVLLDEISMLMGYEITRELPLEDTVIETPIKKATFKKIAGKKLAIVPILRAGLGMVDGLLRLVPVARVGHIGLYRDPETHEPVEYYCKMPPDIGERLVIVVDPMLATGGSAADALTMVKARGAKNIHLMCLVAAPEGVKKVQEAHPDVDIFCAALDEELNDHAYIVPGLGDAGDRIFGTK